ncbi:hypothetical protein AHiyo8_02480 [Arthrobacter sp. Hiyo8]|nr:hypothetical protein AHiyo8_02480 [Arthrobacter sp. Hiyo8]
MNERHALITGAGMVGAYTARKLLENGWRLPSWTANSTTATYRTSSRMTPDSLSLKLTLQTSRQPNEQ